MSTSEHHGKRESSDRSKVCAKHGAKLKMKHHAKAQATLDGSRDTGRRASQNAKQSPKRSGRPSAKRTANGGGDEYRHRHHMRNEAWMAESLSHFRLHDNRRHLCLLFCLGAMLARPTASLRQVMIGEAAQRGLDTLLHSSLLRSVDMVLGMAKTCVARTRMRRPRAPLA